MCTYRNYDCSGLRSNIDNGIIKKARINLKDKIIADSADNRVGADNWLIHPIVINHHIAYN